MTTHPTAEDVAAYARNERPTEDSAFIEEARLAAIQTICDGCQRYFAVASDTASARTFAPSGTDWLYIGDCTEVTTVVEDGTTLTVSTDYQLEPVTATNFAGLAVPYNSLRRLDRCWYTDGPRGTVVVTAKWGFASVPSRIVEAVKILTRDIVDNRDVDPALLATTNPVVRAAIEDYRGPMSWGIA